MRKNLTLSLCLIASVFMLLANTAEAGTKREHEACEWKDFGSECKDGLKCIVGLCNKPKKRGALCTPYPIGTECEDGLSCKRTGGFKSYYNNYTCR